MAELLALAVAIVGISFSFILFLVASRIASAPRDEYERNASRYSRWVDAFLGRAHQKRDGEFDGRVRAGMAYRRRDGRIVPNGQLSESAVDKILQP
jgi:hypothetical protein